MIIDDRYIEELDNGIVSRNFLRYIKIKIDKIDKNRINKLEKYYTNDLTTLQKRRVLKTTPNNKVLSNYARYITELNVGYFMSEPILYNVNEEIDIELLIDTYRKNTINETDKQNVKKASKYGYCYELTYINENTEIKTVSIDPRNAIIFNDSSIEKNNILGIYFYKKEAIKENEDIYILYIYTNNTVIICESNFESVEIHQVYQNIFGTIPLLEVKNNEEKIGDYETVTSLIDSYNKVVSNDIDNIEEFIDSILVLVGSELSKEQLKILRETRVMTLDRDGTGANYLTKTLDETGITTVLDRLRKDIHKFSFTPDMSDEQFSGNVSGVALSYKLLPFELLAKTKQASYEKLVKERFKLYNIFLNKISNMPLIPIEELDVKFKRGLPKNDLEVSDMISKLQGMVTNKTLISNLSFISDANEEDELVKEEQGENKEVKSIVGNNYEELGETLEKPKEEVNE